MIRRLVSFILITALLIGGLLLAYLLSGPAVREAVRGVINRNLPGSADVTRQVNPVPLVARLGEKRSTSAFPMLSTARKAAPALS